MGGSIRDGGRKIHVNSPSTFFFKLPLKKPKFKERTFVKNSYKRSRTSLPSPPLLFIAFFTSHRSPLSERLEQASLKLTWPQTQPE